MPTPTPKPQRYTMKSKNDFDKALNEILKICMKNKNLYDLEIQITEVAQPGNTVDIAESQLITDEIKKHSDNFTISTPGGKITVLR